MNKSIIFILKALRKIYKTIFNIHDVKPPCEQDANKASELIYNELMSNKASMIARFGAFELSTMVNYIGVKSKSKNIIKYIQGKELDWWWNKSLITHMHTNAGFFPPEVNKIENFCELMLKDKSYVDILGSWRVEEKFVSDGMNADKIHLRFLEPFWSDKPWTRVLKNKKILIVHPFKETILRQYENRELLFKNKDILPTFKSLTVLKAIQSIGEDKNKFNDWFEALEYMKDEIDKIDYDICLIGAGAYGFPLAAHVKRQGKQGVHVGGALQLFFGIKGKRWENPNYGVEEWGIKKGSYTKLINEYWVHPDESEKPASANKVEGGCYW